MTLTPNNFDAGALYNAVEDGASRLEAAAGVLYKAIKRYETAEGEYEKALHIQLIVIYDRAKQSGERVPAEDLRAAMAHQHIPEETYGEYLAAKADKEAAYSRYRALAASVSARQSLLKALGGAGA